MAVTVGEKIKLHRKMLGLNQTEFGDRLGVKKNAVSKWECGRVYDIPASKIKAMAEMFGVRPSYLIDDDQEELTLPGNVMPMPSTVARPRLGTIACGEPILAEQNIEGYDQVPDYIKCDFTLTCKGDSMIGARIHDGDIVCIKQQPEVENGQIAAVLIDGDEATLKRFYFENGTVTLQAENPAYPPKVFTGDDVNKVRVLGLATHFISRVI